MARAKRPVGVTLIAVFNLILGIPCLLGALCEPFAEDVAVAMLESLPKPPAGQGEDPVKLVKDEQEFMRKEIPNQKPMLIAFAVFRLAYSLLLLVSAIALLSNKPMGRMLALAAAVLMAITTAGSLVYSAAFVLPAASKWEKQQANVAKPAAAPQTAAIFGVAGLVCSGLIGFGYPAVVFFVLMSGSARQFFSGRPATDLEGDEFDRPRDDFDDSDRRRDDYDDRRDDDDRIRPSPR